MARGSALLVGIGGGSGSGKSALARRLRETLGSDTLTVIEIDSYYRDSASLTPRERVVVNYDHPDAIDWALLLDALRDLREGVTVEMPVYDFTTHERRDEALEIAPTPVILVEGIHCLTHAPLRELLDVRIFVDTDADVRFIRRLRRDILDRDRTIDSVIAQYMATVRPMYEDFVAPSRRHADIIIPEGTGKNELGVELMVEALTARLEHMLDED
ncbi:MAG: uridine kinase [Armatimonadetes bacterium]|nr:uridine kinase [Armatimonadota bacterium]